MTNWCECDLTITGQDVQKVLDAISSEASGDKDERIFDFGKLIPYPDKFNKMDERNHEYGKKVNDLIGSKKNKKKIEKELVALQVEYQDALKDGYNSGGYEWCCRNWGTKWNAFSTRITSQSKKRAMVRFETAWSPPVPVIAVLAERFPDFKFVMKYYEMGMGFQGEQVFENGKLVLDESKDYHGSRGG